MQLQERPNALPTQLGEVVAQIQAALGDSQVLLGEDVSGRSAGIWRSDTIAAGALVRPRTTAEVSQVLRICHAAGQSVVPQGGLTGLVQSAITQPADLALSLEQLNQIEEVDEIERTMVVQTGVPLQVIQETAQAQGLLFPLDLGARGSCTIGGNISTNAGGNRVIRYGMTRDMVLGLEAVLADGTVVSSMNHMIKNNAGYDLKQLFVGTEGTLGVVTRAVLRLREQPQSAPTALAAVGSFTQLAGLLKHLDAGLSGTLSAFEVMWQNFYQHVTVPQGNNTPPLSADAPYYVLFEALGANDDAFQSVLHGAMEQQLVQDAVIATSDAQRNQLWAIRDDVEACFSVGPVFLFDVSLRINHMEAYVAEVNRRLASQFTVYHNFVLGHVGDGNIHFAIGVGDDALAAHNSVERCVYEPLQAIQGSVSAEHGIGLEKKPYLHLSRSETEIDLMRHLKTALDPKGILNPGKVISAELHSS